VRQCRTERAADRRILTKQGAAAPCSAPPARKFHTKNQKTQNRHRTNKKRKPTAHENACRTHDKAQTRNKDETTRTPMSARGCAPPHPPEKTRPAEPAPARNTPAAQRQNARAQARNNGPQNRTREPQASRKQNRERARGTKSKSRAHEPRKSKRKNPTPCLTFSRTAQKAAQHASH
jgi:hypothetical protein